MVSVLLTMFTMDLFFTMSGALGIATQAKLTDGNGDLPEIEKTFAADSLATIAGALFGTQPRAYSWNPVRGLLPEGAPVWWR